MTVIIEMHISTAIFVYYQTSLMEKTPFSKKFFFTPTKIVFLSNETLFFFYFFAQHTDENAVNTNENLFFDALCKHDIEEKVETVFMY